MSKKRMTEFGKLKKILEVYRVKESAKALARRTSAEVASSGDAVLTHDSSTNALIRRYKGCR